MSSQSYNSTAYNASTNYAFVPSTTLGYLGAGSLPGIPTRDASDYTRRLKQTRLLASLNMSRSLYLGNEVRKSVQFALLSCGQCNTGPFPNSPLNG
jgi:hypothetical protein